MKASDCARAVVAEKLDHTRSRIEQEPQIAVVREIANEFETITYPALFDELVTAAQNNHAVTSNEAVPPQEHRTVSVRSIKVSEVPCVLETEQDVDEYLGALRSALLRVLSDDKLIVL